MDGFRTVFNANHLGLGHKQMILLFDVIWQLFQDFVHHSPSKHPFKHTIFLATVSESVAISRDLWDRKLLDIGDPLTVNSQR